MSHTAETMQFKALCKSSCMTPFKQLDFLIPTMHPRGRWHMWACFDEHQNAPLIADPTLESELSESFVNQT